MRCPQLHARTSVAWASCLDDCMQNAMHTTSTVKAAAIMIQFVVLLCSAWTRSLFISCSSSDMDTFSVSQTEFMQYKSDALSSGLATFGTFGVFADAICGLCSCSCGGGGGPDISSTDAMDGVGLEARAPSNSWNSDRRILMPVFSTSVRNFLSR